MSIPEIPKYPVFTGFQESSLVTESDERDPNTTMQDDEIISSRKFGSPVRYYPVESSLQCKFSPGAKKYGRGKEIIYKIKHIETGEAKVGITAQGFRKRMWQHLSCARHPEKDRGRSDLYESMRRSPTKFRMGVVPTQKEELSEELDGSDLETMVIVDHDMISKGFNKIKGGGGGTIVPPMADVDPPSSFQTPEKEYKIKSRIYKERSRLHVNYSPMGGKRKSVVYGFRRDDGKWSIGETSQSFRKRMYGYHYAFDHPEKDIGKRPLVEAVRKEPDRWKVYILYQGPHIKQMEKLWIEAKNAIDDGFNQLEGGGGPLGKK